MLRHCTECKKDKEEVCMMRGSIVCLNCRAAIIADRSVLPDAPETRSGRFQFTMPDSFPCEDDDRTGVIDARSRAAARTILKYRISKKYGRSRLPRGFILEKEERR